MADKLPVRKIDENDCPDLPGDSARQLLVPLNQDLDALFVALDNGLTLNNLRVARKTVAVTGPDEWIPLQLGAGWAAAPGTDTLPPAYLYVGDGTEIKLRGLVTWTGGGSPPAGSVITTLPVANWRERHVVDATNAYGRVDTLTNGQVWYMAGIATSIDLSGVRYTPAVGRLPAWPRPLDVTIGEVNKPPAGRPDLVWLASVEREDRESVGPVSIEGWQAGPISADKRSTVRFRRINGLAQGVKYRLGLVFLLRD